MEINQENNLNFKKYLEVERNYSPATVVAYMADLNEFTSFLIEENITSYLAVELLDVRLFFDAFA